MSIEINKSLLERWHLLPEVHKAYIIQLSALAMVQLLDIATTAIVLEYGGSEGNPLMEMLINQRGIEGFAALKIMGAAALIAILELFRIASSKKQLGEWYLKTVLLPNRIANLFMSSVLINNVAAMASFW